MRDRIKSDPATMLVAPLGKCMSGNASVGLFGMKIRKHFFGTFHGRSNQCSTLATKSATHLHLLHTPEVVGKDGFEIVSGVANEATVSISKEKVFIEGSVALVVLEMDFPQMRHLIQLMGQTEDGEFDVHGHNSKGVASKMTFESPTLAQIEDQLAALKTLHRYKTGNVVPIQFEMVAVPFEAQDVPEDVRKLAVDLSVQEEKCRVEPSIRPKVLSHKSILPLMLAIHRHRSRQFRSNDVAVYLIANLAAQLQTREYRAVCQIRCRHYCVRMTSCRLGCSIVGFL